MGDKQVFSFLGAIIIGLLFLWLFGTLGGLIGAVAGGFLISRFSYTTRLGGNDGK